MVPMAKTVQRKCRILSYLLSNETVTTRGAADLIDLDLFWGSRLLQKMYKEGHLVNVAPYGKRKIFKLNQDRLDVIQAILKFYFKKEGLL